MMSISEWVRAHPGATITFQVAPMRYSAIGATITRADLPTNENLTGYGWTVQDAFADAIAKHQTST